MTEQTINLTPITNPATILAYAGRVKTDRPWDHIAGQLHALSELSAKYDELSESLSGDALAWAFVNAFGDAHRMVSNEFASFFGEGQTVPNTPLRVVVNPDTVDRHTEYDSLVWVLATLIEDQERGIVVDLDAIPDDGEQREPS